MDTIISYLLEFQIFHSILGLCRDYFGDMGPIVFKFLSAGLFAFIIVNIAALIGGLGTYAERKISADIQARYGPNRVGPLGLLQFLADGIKMVFKEDIVPNVADKFLFTLAPLLCIVGVFATFAVVPFSSNFLLTDLNVGVFYLLGVASLVGVGIFLGGYASNSKWAMLGGMRGAAQIISYEIPVTLSILPIVILSGGMSLKTIVQGQGGMPWEWYLFHNPFTFIGLFVYFVGILAETNRAPFDLPEAESELVSGYHTEYTGMRFAFFALAEYVEVFVVCTLGVILFLGGYQLPFEFELGPKNIGTDFAQLGVILGKAFILYYIIIWIRWTLPRLRVDQLMTLCWKYLTPISLFNLVGSCVWMYCAQGKSLFQLIAG